MDSRYVVLHKPGTWDEVNIHVDTLQGAVKELQKLKGDGVIYDTIKATYFRLKGV